MRVTSLAMVRVIKRFALTLKSLNRSEGNWCAHVSPKGEGGVRALSILPRELSSIPDYFIGDCKPILLVLGLTRHRGSIHLMT